MLRAERRLDHSFSLHAAQRRDTYLIFALGLTLSMILFGVWFWGWLVPTHQPGGAFRVVFTIFLTLMVLAAWIPWRPGLKGQVHDSLYYTAAGLLPGIAFLSARVTDVSSLAQRVSWWVFWLDIILAIAFFIWNKQIKQRFFIFQAVFITVAFVQLLAITYI